MERQGNDHKDKLSENEIVMILRKYASYLIMLKVDLQLSESVIKKCGGVYKVTQDHIDDLILTINIHQSLTTEKLRAKSLNVKNQRTAKFLVKCNNLNIVLGIRLSIKHISTLKDLRNILQLNKLIYTSLKKKVIKQVLLRAKIPITDPKKLEIWRSVLDCVFLVKQLGNHGGYIYGS